MRGIGFELVADASDVRDDPFTVVGRHGTPDQLGELIARHHRSLRPGERHEQLVLDRREVDDLAPPPRTAAGYVELERPPTDRIGRAVAALQHEQRRDP